jgi:hypothetical protein
MTVDGTALAALRKIGSRLTRVGPRGTLPDRRMGPRASGTRFSCDAASDGEWSPEPE